MPGESRPVSGKCTIGGELIVSTSKGRMTREKIRVSPLLQPPPQSAHFSKNFFKKQLPLASAPPSTNASQQNYFRPCSWCFPLPCLPLRSLPLSSPSRLGHCSTKALRPGQRFQRSFLAFGASQKLALSYAPHHTECGFSVHTIHTDPSVPSRGNFER